MKTCSPRVFVYLCSIILMLDKKIECLGLLIRIMGFCIFGLYYSYMQGNLLQNYVPNTFVPNHQHRFFYSQCTFTFIPSRVFAILSIVFLLVPSHENLVFICLVEMPDKKNNFNFRIQWKLIYVPWAFYNTGKLYR